MAFPQGFHYFDGGYRIVYSDISSTATFLAHNPVTLSDIGRALVEADSQTTLIFGIAQADAAKSIGGTLAGKCPVLVPQMDTVFIAKTDADLGAGALEVGENFNLKKVNDHLRVDPDSVASARVTLVARGFTNVAYDSDDSTVACQFLQDFVGPYGSTQSRRYD